LSIGKVAASGAAPRFMEAKLLYPAPPLVMVIPNLCPGSVGAK